MSLFKELKRRNVFRIASIYAVVAWILMQVAGTLEESLKLPEWFDSVVTAGLIIGFPIALLLAWAFEMTPEGVKRTSDTADGELVSTSKMDGLILLGIVAVLGLGVWQQLSDKKPVTQADIPKQAEASAKKTETIKPNSIAVLPFTDLSPNKDQEYFSDGMAEEILNVLVRVDALKVTSRTSAFQFKGQEIGIPDIAKKLMVRYVVEGSVRKAGDKLRITTQLIDAQDDKHLWSDTFDRPLTTDSIFAIQDEISNAIVKALEKKLNLSSNQPLFIKQTTGNLSAYELYLQARPLFQARKELDKADELLIKALEKDPKFAQAWAMRAALQFLLVDYGFKNASRQQIDKTALEFVNKALTLDANTALALAVKSTIELGSNQRLTKQYDLTGIIEGYKKALKIEPHNPSTLNWIGLAYQFIGFRQQALKYFSTCVEYEPRYAPCVINKIIINDYLGNYEIAMNQYTESLSKGLVVNGFAPFQSLSHQHQKLVFLSALNTSNLFIGWSRIGELYQAYQNPHLDHSELTQAAYNYLSKRARTVGYWQFVLTPLGFEDPIDGVLIDVFRVKHKNINSLKTKSYLRKTGVYAYWQKHGYPPQCHPIGEDDFECE